jgi:hypothetical protein
LPINEIEDLESLDGNDEINKNLEDLELRGYITTEQDWQERLQEWNEMLNEEKNAEENGNIQLEERSINEELLADYTHPAIDIEAKWDLRDVFIRELKIPSFISLESNE